MPTPTFSLRKLLSATSALGLLLASSLAGFAQAPPPTTPRWSWGTALDHPTLNGFVSTRATVVDAVGNQYVTGVFQGSAGFGNTIITSHSAKQDEPEMYVAKLSPTGQWLWAVGTGSATSISQAADIALDPQGRVVVVGTFSGSLTLGGNTVTCTAPRSNVVVARLSAQGQWLSAAAAQVTSGNGVLTNYFEAYDKSMLSLDAQGNAIIIGRFNGDVTFGNYPLTGPPQQNLSYVASLSAATNTWQWAKLVGDGITNFAQLVGVATGTQGDIWVTGHYGGSPLTLGTTTLHTFSLPGNGSNMFLGHLSATGQWLDASGMGSQLGVKVTQIVADGHDNLYLTGNFKGTANFGTLALATQNSQNSGFEDAFLAKRNANGQWEWAIAGGGAGTDTGHELVVDGQGEVYWTGTVYTSYSWLSDLEFGPTTIPLASMLYPIGSFISKVGPAGQWRWTKAIGQNYTGFALGVSAQGQVYLATSYSDPTPFQNPSLPPSVITDVVMGQVSAQGALSFAAHSESGGTATITHILNDEHGNSYVTGNFMGRLILGGTPLQAKSESDLFVAKLNRQGAVQWALHAGSEGMESGERLALDGQGGLLLAGWSTDTLQLGSSVVPSHYSGNLHQAHNGFLARISPQGQWASAVIAPSDLTALKVDAGGALTIVGAFTDTLQLGTTTLIPLGNTDGYIARLSASNQWQWAKQIATTNFDMATGLVLDSAGNAYVVGTHGDSLAFGATILRNIGMYIARLSSAGQWQWAKAFTGSSYYFDRNNLSIAPDDRHLLVSGGFTDSITLGASYLSTHVRYQEGAFVGAMDLNGQWLWAIAPGGDGATVAGPASIDRYGTGYLFGGAVGAARFGTDSIVGRPGRRVTSPAPFVPGAHLRGGPPLPPIPTSFIAAFTAPNQWQWAELAYGATTMSVSTEGDLYLGGSLSGLPYYFTSFTPNDSIYTTGGFTQRRSVLPVGFVTAALNGPTGLSTAATTRPTFGLWPNPARHTIQLMDLPKGAATVRIVNAVGAVVMQQRISGNPAAVTLNLPNLVPGLYVVQCGGASRRLVVE